MFKKLFGQKQKNQAASTVEKGWQLTVKGEVVAISRLDIDKSGKNPKYMIHLRLKVESVDDGGFGVTVGPEIQAQGHEKDLLQHIEKLPDVGDHVVIQSSGFDKQPSRLNINQITLY
ncbi:MAG: hypothetical protein IAE79_11110 [Anaerolinea sp.]|nr:hypothetical protein [Anaerolinea sp.]